MTHSIFNYGHIVKLYSHFLYSPLNSYVYIYIGYWTLNIYYYYYYYQAKSSFILFFVIVWCVLNVDYCNFSYDHFNGGLSTFLESKIG